METANSYLESRSFLNTSAIFWLLSVLGVRKQFFLCPQVLKLMADIFLICLTFSSILPLHLEKHPNALLCPQRSPQWTSDQLSNLILCSPPLHSLCHYLFSLKCYCPKFLPRLDPYHHPCFNANVTFSERHFPDILINYHFPPLAVPPPSCYNSERELPQVPDLENHYLKRLTLTCNRGSSMNSKEFGQCLPLTLFDPGGKEHVW